MSIQYLTYKEIDKKKWNDSIARSSNCLIFAYSWYLDIVANKQWDALILGDYETVMPLAWRKKLSISYLYQPFFTNQLGVFSTKKITEKMVEDFLNAIPKTFKFIDIGLNYANNFRTNLYPQQEKVCQYVDLNNSYDSVKKFYSDNLKRNLKLAANAR